MTPTNYQRGRAKEYDCVRGLKKLGMWAQRTPGSKGPFDVIAFDNAANQVVIIQVKNQILSDGEARSARRELHAFKTPPCVRKELWMWGTRGWELQVLNPVTEIEAKPPAPKPGLV